ncbi:MAG: V-type ATP synthase subunit D [Chloroflexota bacterium]|nr:V-type ATP synthase subunit D [Chloroflexota bacterium]
MPQRLNVPPTRSSLLRTRERLETAREGYEILDQKREVLSTELIHVAHDAEGLESKVHDLLETAYQALELAKMTMGRERIEWAALAVNKTMEVEVKPRSVMGVVIPTIEAHGEPPEIPYGLGDTATALDEAGARFREVLDEIPDLCETMTAVWRLARELRKTQRRVNALEHIFIPKYEETVAYIESTLEEREREETFRLKLLKSKMVGGPTVGPPTREYVQPYRDITLPGTGSGEKRSPYRDVGGGKSTTTDAV